MVQLETHILRMITNNTVEWNINASEVSWNQGGFYYAKKQAGRSYFYLYHGHLHGLRDDCVQYRAEHRRGAGNNLYNGDPWADYHDADRLRVGTFRGRQDRGEADVFGDASDRPAAVYHVYDVGLHLQHHVPDHEPDRDVFI